MARAILEEAINPKTKYPMNHPTAWWLRRAMHAAVCLMHRRKPAKPVARKGKEHITPATRRLVKKLAAQGVSNFEIAKRAKLRNPGRVTDILHGKR
jgi:hypothetical protein